MPPQLAARAFGWAWGIAIALHLIAVGGLLSQGAPQPVVAPPIARMVFVEPPPPPPIAAQPAPDTTKIVAPEPKPVPKRIAKPTPTRVAKPRPEPTPQPAPVAPVVAPNPSAGQHGGVVAGFTGGVVNALGTAPLPANKVATPPTLVRRVEPKYPAEARRQEIEGLVVVEAIVDESGRVEPGAHVLRSIPPLDDEAIAAVKQFRFRPARNRDGSPVRVIVEVPLRFVLR